MSNVTRMPPSGGAVRTTSPEVSRTSLLQSGFDSLMKRATMRIGPNGQPMGIPVSFPAGKSPSNEERTALTETVEAIRAAMATEVTEGEVERSIALLLGSGLKQSAQLDGANMGLAYAMVLSEVPSVILKQAVTSVSRGKAEGMDRTFMPSAGDLLAYCERLKADYLAKASMIEAMLALPEEKLPDPEDEDRQRDMRGKLTDLARTVRRA